VIRFEGMETALGRFQNQDIFFELWSSKNLALVSGNNHAKFGAYIYCWAISEHSLTLSLSPVLYVRMRLYLCARTLLS
jgi:hypothetical protein